MKNLTCEQMLDQAHRAVVEELKKGNEPDSMVYIHRNEKPWQVLALDYSGQMGLTKDLNQDLIRRAIVLTRSCGEFGGCVMVGNAWFTTYDATKMTEKEIHEDFLKTPPSKSPKRKECFVFLAWDKEGKRAVAVYDRKDKFTIEKSVQKGEGEPKYQCWLDSVFNDAEKIMASEGEKTN